MAKIIVQNTQITVIKQNEDDYISLTDMLKAKDGEFFFSNWLRNRNTIEFLGIWERLMNQYFNCAEFDIIDSRHLYALRLVKFNALRCKISAGLRL